MQQEWTRRSTWTPFFVFVNGAWFSKILRSAPFFINTTKILFQTVSLSHTRVSLSGVYSVWVLQAAAFLLRVAVAEPLHNTLQARLNDTKQGSLGGVPVPAGLHQLPALFVKSRHALWSGTWWRTTWIQVSLWPKHERSKYFLKYSPCLTINRLSVCSGVTVTLPYMTYHFMAELLSFPIASTLL